MSKDYPVQTANMEAMREQAVEVLVEQFSRDVMGLDEFEGLLDAVNRCSTAGELRALLAKLPPLEASESATDMIPARGGEPVVVDADRIKKYGLLLSSTKRTGRWIPARKTATIGLLGGVSLDFREALLGPGITELSVLALLGSIEIIVPPEMAVEVDGVALPVGFQHQTNAPLRSDPDIPTLRIRGLALLGGVDVKVRLPGETPREAKRRRRLERREERRRLSDPS